MASFAHYCTLRAALLTLLPCSLSAPLAYPAFAFHDANREVVRLYGQFPSTISAEYAFASHKQGRDSFAKMTSLCAIRSPQEQADEDKAVGCILQAKHYETAITHTIEVRQTMARPYS